MMKFNLSGRLAVLLVLILTLIEDCSAANQDGIAIGVLYSKLMSGCFEYQSISRTLSMYDIKVQWKEVTHTNTISITRDVCDLVDLNITGLVTLLPQSQQEVVSVQTKALHITHLPIDTQPVPSFPLPSVHVSLPFSTQSQLIKDLLSDTRWTEVAVIFDDIIDDNDRQSLIRYIDDGKRDITTLAASLTSRELVKVTPEIKMIPVPNYSHFIFLGRGDIWRRLIKSRLDLLTDSIYWFVISDVPPEQLAEIVKNRPLCNVVTSREIWRRCLSVSMETASHFILSNTTSMNLLETILEKSLMALAETLPLLNGRRNLSCARYVLPSSLRLTEPLMHCLPDISTNYNTYELHSTYGHKQVEVKPVGNWRLDTGIVTDQRSLFLNSYPQFNRNPILVAATDSPPFVNRLELNGNLSYTGFSIDILDELAVRMGFNYSIIEPPDNFFGAPNPDGTWNGMVGMVHRGEAEMAIGPFTITSLREQVIDFTVPFAEGSTGIMYLSPGFEANKSLFQTLKPFSVVVWGTLLIAVLFVGIVSYLVNHYTPYGREKDDRPLQAEYETSIGDNIWMVYGSVTEQGTTYSSIGLKPIYVIGILHSPEAVSGRCVLGLWWIFTILLVATYTANLAAFLIVSLPPPSINNLGELIAQDKIQPIVQAGTSFETIFKEARTDLYRKAWGRIQNSPLIAEQPDILELVRTGKYAFIDDRPLLEYEASSSCLTYAVADESFDSVGYGIVIPEDSPYERTINNLIRKMQEGGLIENWKQKWWAPSGSCRDTSENSVKSLDLDSLGGLFLFYLGIVALAFMYLAVETFTHLIGNNYQMWTKPSEKQLTK